MRSYFQSFVLILSLIVVGASPVLAIEGRTRISSAPYIITAPGHYFVARDLSIGETVITVNASGVTLDLNGFRLENTSSVGAVILSFGQGDITIRDGHVHGGEYGIVISSGHVATVEDLTVVGASEHGLVLDGVAGITVQRNRLHDHGGSGLHLISGPVPEPGLIEGNSIRACGAGMYAEAIAGLVVRYNRVQDVAGDGIHVGGLSVLEKNAIWNAGGYGLIVGEVNIVRENTVSDAAGTGIRIEGYGNRVVGNIVQGGQGVALEIAGSWNELDRNLLAQNGDFGLLFTGTSMLNVYRQNVARGNMPGTCTGSMTHDACDAGSVNTSDGTNFIPTLQ